MLNVTADLNIYCSASNNAAYHSACAGRVEADDDQSSGTAAVTMATDGRHQQGYYVTTLRDRQPSATHASHSTQPTQRPIMPTQAFRNMF